MLELREVTKVFRSDGHAVRALDGVTLKFPGRGFAIIAGSNGSGKTTLLNTIAGSSHPDSGQVLLADEDISALPDFRRPFVGRLFQDTGAGTCPDLTVEENLSIAQMDAGPRLLRLGRTSTKRTRIVDLMRSVAADLGLQLRLQDKVQNLSGGQMQIINILFLMLRQPQPSFILADEPTNNLDPDNADICIRLLNDMSSTSSVVMVTHDGRAYAHGDRLIVMHKGRIVADLNGADVSTTDPMEVIRQYEPTVK